eukprot:TRINITY_DN5393_c1_g1_i3.p2 TRINITY_DN5393_c1_g1~~TRINITY_DN5393_c1_g1_i3.p2  ORF type:complete len:340 (+),score=54.03 TRINITY_DN5393_c1_g1_i3:1-1020(+)
MINLDEVDTFTTEVLDAVTELQKLKIYLDEHVLSIIVRQLKQNRDRLIKQDIIPVLKVLRSHKYRDEFLMEMIADSARQQLHKVPDLITLLEHFVAFQTYDGVLYFLCALHFRNSLDRYSLQELINIVQVFSRALHFDRELFEAVLLRLYDYLDDMSSYEYATVIKGIAKFDEEVCRESARMFAEYLFDSGICREEDLNVISVARSLAFLRLWERGLWDKVSWRIQKILNKFAGRQLPLRKLYDLFHAQSMAEACGASHVKLIDIKDRQSTLRTLQEKLQRRPITTSKLQDDIFHSLKRLGYRSIEAEKRIDLPMRFVDIALSVEGVPVAFEVDGPIPC